MISRLLKDASCRQTNFRARLPSSNDEGNVDASTLDSDLIVLDPRFSKSEWKELKKENKDPLNVEILRPIPDGDFELAPFGDDPTRCFKLGKGISEPTHAQLVACLRENADLFARAQLICPVSTPASLVIYSLLVVVLLL